MSPTNQHDEPLITKVQREPLIAEPAGRPKEYRLQLVWPSIAFFASLHVAALYGAWLLVTDASWPTVFFVIVMYHCSGLGITAGVHRLWSHKSYKARLPLRLILVLFNTIAFQKPVIVWARDHRVHHKFSETNADPHNANRGFFFAHVGWLLCRKHPDVIEKGKTIDMSDLENDPILKFQQAHYVKLVTLACFVLPTVVPVYGWGETWSNAWYASTVLRYVLILNVTWVVNSVAHMYGNQPYDRYINPSENATVSAFALGEGWHNYHHTFPWDYRTAEIGNYRFNLTTAFINLMAKIGWAYDLKTVPEETVMKRVLRTGDGSHHKYGHSHNHNHGHENDVWGWGDEEMTPEDKDSAIVVNGKKNHSEDQRYS